MKYPWIASEKHKGVFMYETKKKGVLWGYRLRTPIEATKSGFKTENEAYVALCIVVATASKKSTTQTIKDDWVKFSSESSNGDSDSEFNGNTLLKDWIEYWYKTYKEGKNHNTSRNNRTAVYKFIIPLLGDIKLDNLTTDRVIHKFINYMRETSYDDSTIHQYLKSLTGAINEAVKLGYIERSKIIGVLKYAEPTNKKEQTALTVEEIKQVQDYLESLFDPHFYAVLNFIMTCGCRVGEAIALYWKDINFEENTANFYKTRYPNNEFGPPKTKNGKRKIEIEEDTIKILEAYKSISAKLLGRPIRENDLIFLNPNTKQPITALKVWKECKKIAKSLNVPITGPHTFRHSIITHMINTLKLSDSIVAKYVGDTPSTIAKFYVHVQEVHMKEAVIGIGSLYRKKK